MSSNRTSTGTVSTTRPNRSKVLAPLLVLVAAGAVTVSSGAAFTSQSVTPPNVVSAGTLSHTNTAANQSILDLRNLKPGDVADGTATLTNTGTLAADFGLTEITSTNEFADGVLTLAIVDETSGDVVYAGDFGDLVDGTRTGLGVYQPGEVRTYRFTVELSANADNTQQGLAAAAEYRWDAVQAD